MDDLTTEQKLLILNKAVERFRRGEVPVVARSRRFIFEGHFAGDSYEESLCYTLDLRGDKPLLRAYSYHLELSSTVEMEEYCEAIFVEITRLMLELNTEGVDPSSNVVYQRLLKKIM